MSLETVFTIANGATLKIAVNKFATMHQLTVVNGPNSGVVVIKHRYSRPKSDRDDNTVEPKDWPADQFDHDTDNDLTLTTVAGKLKRTAVFNGRFSGFSINNTTGASIDVEVLSF